MTDDPPLFFKKTTNIIDNPVLDGEVVFCTPLYLSTSSEVAEATPKFGIFLKNDYDPYSAYRFF